MSETMIHIREKNLTSQVKLAARIEPFDTFWEGPEDIEKGYTSFYQFYKHNYLKYLPQNKAARILVVSCGPGYFVDLAARHGYTNVTGIDSDPAKVAWATDRNLNCQIAEAFPFLEEAAEPFDVIFCEQELNHLTKDEIVMFLDLCWERLTEEGTLIAHVLNGANPITGAEALAQNFDHFNTFTDYTLHQVLGYCGFDQVKVIPLNLYVFYKNPMNYVAMLAAGLLSMFFRFCFVLYGKKNKIFTKKIAAVARKKSPKGRRGHST